MFVVVFACLYFIGTTSTTTTTDRTEDGIFSVTEVEKGIRYQPGDLVFEEAFDTFDLDLWRHDITASGGGVSFFT